MCVCVRVCNCCSPLFIQKVNGGGRPGGGLQVRTSGEPSVTNTGSRTSLGHRGASGGWGRGGGGGGGSNHELFSSPSYSHSYTDSHSYSHLWLVRVNLVTCSYKCHNDILTPCSWDGTKANTVTHLLFLLETRSRILLDRAIPKSFSAKHWYSPS